MDYQKEEFESKNLGIIAGIIDDIGIVEKINDIFLIDSREKINTEEVVKAIILNGLGFVSKALYLFSQFFEDKLIYQPLPSATTSKERFIYNDITGALFFDRDGSGCGFTQVKFAQLSAGLSLTQNNFVVV